MSDVTGPAMLAVTNILRPPRARVGKITENFVLPRTIELRKLLVGGAGVFVGLLFWLFFLGFIVGHTLMPMLFSGAFFGALSIFLISWSPLRGESFARWLGLSASTIRADRVRVDGIRARAYLGIAPLQYTAAGRTRILSGAANVPAGSVDERGVLVHHSDMLLRYKSEAATNYPSFPQE